MKIAKIILIPLLFLCLFDMPYDYYQFVRILVTIVFGHLAFKANEEKSGNTFYYLVVVALFQPFLKIPLNSSTWNTIDIVVACYLAYSVRGKGNKLEK